MGIVREYIYGNILHLRIGKDELFADVNAKHVVVIRNGHFYSFDLLDNIGMPRILYFM